MTVSYLDFDLSIEPIDAAAAHYRARVLHSPAGQARSEFRLPFSALELENSILKLGRPRRSIRSLQLAEEQVAFELGGKLYCALFTLPIHSVLTRSLDQATAQEQGLRLRLRLDGSPELHNLPWEYLYDASLNRFFALDVYTPLVRYLELPQRINPLAVQLPLRVLVLIANPSDYVRLDVETEWQRINQALTGLKQRGLA